MGSILNFCLNLYRKYKIDRETEQVIETIFNEEIPTLDVVEYVPE